MCSDPAVVLRYWRMTAARVVSYSVEQIFEVHTSKMAVDREGVDFRILAQVSERLTGAEIEARPDTFLQQK